MANNYKNAKVDLTSTAATTLYTAPTSTTTIVKSILVSEDSGNVSANATVELLSAPLVVEESEILKVTAATANRLHVVTSLLEIG